VDAGSGLGVSWRGFPAPASKELTNAWCGYVVKRGDLSTFLLLFGDVFRLAMPRNGANTIGNVDKDTRVPGL